MLGPKLLNAMFLTFLPAIASAAGGCVDYAQNQLEHGLIRTESSGNPFAIGVVGARLARQPRNLEEAVATAASLEVQGFNYSVGCRQINKTNFGRYGLTIRTAFDPAMNSKTGSDLFSECLTRAISRFGNNGAATRAALSCYYSGNFKTGQQKEGNQPSYVDKVLANAGVGGLDGGVPPIPVISSKAKSISADKRKAALPPSPTNEHVPKAGDAKLAEWDVFNEQ